MRNIYKLLIFIQLSLIVLIAKGQSTCATALTLTPGTAQCGTNSYAGSFQDDGSAPTNPCDSYYNDGEYWFKYVGAGKPLKLDVSGLTATYSGIYVLDACPSSSPTCIASYNAGGSTANYSVTTPILTTGHTYYIVMANWSTPYSTYFCLNSTEIQTYLMANGSTITSCNGIFQDPEGTSNYADHNGTMTMTFCSGTGDALQFNFTEFETKETADNLKIYDGPTTASTLIGTYSQTNGPGTITSSGTCLTFTWTTDNNQAGTVGWTANFHCVPPPPSNNECANATSLTVNSDLNCGTVTHGTTQNATASSQANSCSGTADDDVWYKFVATSTAHKISLLNITGSSTDMYFAVYSGSCGSLTNILCSDAESNTVTGLTAGNTYYVRVYTYSSGYYANYDICVGTPPPPPSNNECANATSLTVNTNQNCTSVTNGTTQSATASSQTNPCSGTADDDVWYKFVATNSSHIISLLNITGTATDMYFVVYSGSCGSLTKILCSDLESNIVTGLTVGNTYYVRVYTYSSVIGYYANYDICVGTPPPPPSNNECANATSLTVNTNQNCTTVTHGSTLSATASSQANSCSGTADDDVWYKFVATSTAHVISLLNITGSSTDMYFAVYSGSCGSLTNILCSDANSATITGLTIGSTYYVRVYTYSSGIGYFANFDICVSLPPPPPSNDECSNATALTINSSHTCAIVTHGTTQDALPSSQSNPCYGTPDDDVWYYFTATNDTLEINLLNITGTSTDMYFAVYSGNDCNNLTNILCSDYNTELLTGLTVGSKYYVRVYTYYSGDYANFDICVSPPPPAPSNDECSNATALVVNTEAGCPITTSGYTQNATASSQANSCYVTADDDVWYYFIATNDTINISLLNITGTSTDMYFAVYSGNDCNNLTNILCSDYNTELLTGLTVGSKYYVRVYTYSSGYYANFDLCVSQPVPMPGGLCSSSLPFCSDSTYNFPAGVDTGTGESGPNYCCLHSTPNPVWYYLRVDQPGDIQLDIHSNPQKDLDFICWGPFTNIDDPCVNPTTYLTNNASTCYSHHASGSGGDYPSGNTVDCSYDPSYQEWCYIPNAQVGQFYILLITNYSNEPCNIIFNQISSGGSPGHTDCNVVICNISELTVEQSVCNPSTNNYSISGLVSFSDPPTSGQLIVTDNSGVSQTFNAPFTSPISYSLINLVSDGTNHFVTAEFSDAPSCTASNTYTAPPACNMCNASAGADKTVCGTTTNLEAVINPDNASYHWSPTAGISFANVNSPTSSITATAPGVYTLTWNVTSTYALTCTDQVVITFNSSMIWTGNAGDGNWHNAANWCGVVPTPALDAIIPNGCSTYPNNYSSSTATCKTLSIESAASVSVANNITLDCEEDVINNGTLTMVGNSTLKCGRHWNNINGTFNAGNGTVVFDSNDGTINTGGNGSGKKFYNVECNAAGKTKTQNGAIDCDNNFTITAGTWSTGGNSMNIAGNWTNNGTFTHGNNLVILDGINQTIGGTVSTTFYNLTNTNTSSTLNINTIVKNVLTLTNGFIELNQKTLIIDNSSPTAITRTNGYINSSTLDKNYNSKVQWNIGTIATGEYIFPFGISGTYIPFKFKVTTAGVGNVSVSSYPTGGTDASGVYSNKPNIVTNLNSPLYPDPPAPGNAINIVRRFWYINKSGGSGRADLTFNWAASEDPLSGAISPMIAQRYLEALNKWEYPPLDAQNSSILTTPRYVTVPNVINFSPWAITRNDHPLPISLLYFNGNCKDSIVELNWATASEINNDYFTIEYTNILSEQNTMWTPIAIIDGAGNNNTIKTYQYIDKPYKRDNSSDVIFYRLKQTDFNGSFTYSNTIDIHCLDAQDNDIEIINAYCEQQNNCNVVTVIFRMSGDEEYTIKLYDVYGQQIATTTGISKDGLNQTQIYLNNTLDQAVYVVILLNNERIKTKKVLLY